MTSVADVRKYLEELIAADGSEETNRIRADAKVLLTELARFDGKDLSELPEMFLSLFKRRSMPAATPSQTTKAEGDTRNSRDDEARFLEALRNYILDDRAFAAQLSELEGTKSVSREGLNRIYNALFDKDRPLAKKASRAKLIRDISDQRVVVVRSQKAAEVLLGRRIVPAE